MTVSTTTNKVIRDGDGTNDTFSYNFKIFADGDLDVYIRTAAGTETLQTLTTNYSVTGAGNDSGGNVVFVSGQEPAATEKVVIQRKLDLTQSTDYTPNDPFPADSHEEALDRLTFITQQIQEEVDRSIKASVGNTFADPEFTVDATTRANKIFAFDSDGDLSIAQEIGTYQGTDTTTTTEAYSQRDIVKSTSTAELNNVYICVADSVVGDLLTDTDHFALLIDAVSAATSATNASNSADDAEKLAINAEDSQFTLSDGSTTGYSALHHKEKALDAQTAAETAETNAQGHENTAQDWATKTTGVVSGGEYSAKEYASGAAQSTGSAKQWALGGGASFDVNTVVANSLYSARKYAQDAANSASDASGSLSSFQAIWHGTSATDPTGADVNAGDLYFNSTTQTLRVYGSSGWVDAAVSSATNADKGFATAMAVAL